MKLIRQKNHTDCGVAALAMATDISYRRAMKILHPEMFYIGLVCKKNGNATTKISEILDALDRLKIKYTYCENKFSLDFLNKKAIIFVKVDHATWHGLAWCPNQKRILDPFAGNIGKCYWWSTIIIED
jgi:hypothetical protein